MTLTEIEDKLEELMPGKGIAWEDANFNKLGLETTWVDVTAQGAEYFNSIYNLVKNWKEAVRTKSGGISIKGRDFRFCTQSVLKTKTGCELIIIAPRYCYRVVFRSDYGKGDEGKMSGKAAFSKFCDKLKAKGYNIADDAIDNGLEVKKTIPRPDIRVMFDCKNITLQHAFHVDINSAYMAGIKKEYGHCGNGILGEVIQDIFDHRKDNTKSAKYNKSILNCSQGFMQSQYCVLNHKSYALAHMSKAGIVFCYNKLQEIIHVYQGFGCKLVGTNTDGAWFIPPENFTRIQAENVPGFGSGLGEFKIDAWDCQLRYKSAGAYEYICEGKYTPKLRGHSSLDDAKPRSEWEWGDIYRKEANPIKFTFIKGEGLLNEKENEDRCLRCLCSTVQ